MLMQDLASFLGHSKKWVPLAPWGGIGIEDLRGDHSVLQDLVTL